MAFGDSPLIYMEAFFNKLLIFIISAIVSILSFFGIAKSSLPQPDSLEKSIHTYIVSGQEKVKELHDALERVKDSIFKKQ